jgi:hypothetical protein
MKFIAQHVFDAGMRADVLYSEVRHMNDPAGRLTIQSYGSRTSSQGMRATAFDLNGPADFLDMKRGEVVFAMQEALTRLLNKSLDRLSIHGLKTIQLEDFGQHTVTEDKVYAIWDSIDFELLRTRLEQYAAIENKPRAYLEKKPKLFIWTPIRDTNHTVGIVHNTKEEAFAVASELVKNYRGEGNPFVGWGTDDYTLTTKDMGQAFVIQYE